MKLDSPKISILAVVLIGTAAGLGGSISVNSKIKPAGEKAARLQDQCR